MRDCEDALMREYEKVVDLWAHEGEMALNLASIWVVLQVGLGSAVALLYVQKATWGSLGYLFFFVAGALTNAAWFFMLSRAKVRRDNWSLLGLQLERKLACVSKLSIFEIENALHEQKTALELFEGKIRERKVNWWEKPGVSRIVHYGVILMLIIWIALILASWLYKFPVVHLLYINLN